MEARERIVFLDTETTGLDPRHGHRIIEIACVEAIGREISGRQLHFYLDPEREIDIGATAVHGLTWEDLKGKPSFFSIAQELLGFLAKSTLIIHNAPFDLGFLNQELKRIRQQPLSDRDDIRVTDTLQLAKRRFPGKRNSLDALCDRLGVDNAHRSLHGALLDARLLSDVYFAMTRGQTMLDIVCAEPAITKLIPATMQATVLQDVNICPVHVSATSELAHDVYLQRLSDMSAVPPLWAA